MLGIGGTAGPLCKRDSLSSPLLDPVPNSKSGPKPHSGMGLSAVTYGGASLPGYSELRLCDYNQQDIETDSAAAPSSCGVLGDE
eukprot:8729677-Pyramimonas_sp.AAC.1